MDRSLDFYFGVGSRYSYLAATQSPVLIADTGAKVRWRALYSPDLISRVGEDPFRPGNRRGQYDPAYRTLDAQRWATYYAVPYREPDFDAVDWRRIALWAAAAARHGAGEGFGRWALEATFAHGRPPRELVDVRKGAAELGLDPDQLARDVAEGLAEAQHDEHLEAAAAAGAFGVPTFVADDGSVFWGQDRLPLLRSYLGDHRESAPDPA